MDVPSIEGFHKANITMQLYRINIINKYEYEQVVKLVAFI